MTRTRLPDRRRNMIREIIFDRQAFTVCVGYDDAGRPLEVFADGCKTGSTMAAFIDDACIVISMALQYGAGALAVRGPGLGERHQERGPGQPDGRHPRRDRTGAGDAMGGAVKPEAER